MRRICNLMPHAGTYLCEFAGVDFSKSLPSRLQMLGLVFKPNVREALTKVAAGLQEAGVNPQVEFSLL